MNRLIYVCFIFLLFTENGFSQKINVDFRKIEIEPGLPAFRPISSMELSPDKKTIAIGTGQGPVYIWDIASEKLLKKIDVDGYYAGPAVFWSTDGKYLLLKKMHYMDWKPNKDKTTKVEVLDLESGKIVFSKPDLHDAAFTPDSKHIVTYSGTEAEIYAIGNGDKIRSIHVEDAGFAIAVSNDGRTIAVSHKLRKEDLENIPTVRDDKKAQKAALKFREAISFYDIEKGNKIRTANDIFDIVYSMKYTKDGKKLLVYNIANTKLQVQANAGGSRQGYISQVIAETGEVTRTIVSSMIAEPDYKESFDNNYLGVTSMEIDRIMVPTVLVYDLSEGNLIYKMEINVRLFQEKSTFTATSFVFLPDNDKIILNYLGRLAVWEFKKKE